MAKENLLLGFLKKIGVQDFSELREEEKNTYREWEKILSHEVRIEDVAKFLERQVKHLNGQLHDAIKEDEDRLALILTAKIENYEAIMVIINEPMERRKSLEQQLLEKL